MANKYQELFNFCSNQGMQIKAKMKVVTELEWERCPEDLGGEETEDCRGLSPPSLSPHTHAHSV